MQMLSAHIYTAKCTSSFPFSLQDDGARRHPRRKLLHQERAARDRLQFLQRGRALGLRQMGEQNTGGRPRRRQEQPPPQQWQRRTHRFQGVGQLRPQRQPRGGDQGGEEEAADAHQVAAQGRGGEGARQQVQQRGSQPGAQRFFLQVVQHRFRRGESRQKTHDHQGADADAAQNAPGVVGGLVAFGVEGRPLMLN
jgi:hypothetical protein